MAKLMSLRIDVTKIRKERLYQGKKGTYLDLVVALRDDKDAYENNVSCWEAMSEDERNAKEPKNYLGNGRVFWEDDGQEARQEQEPATEEDIPF